MSGPARLPSTPPYTVVNLDSTPIGSNSLAQTRGGSDVRQVVLRGGTGSRGALDCQICQEAVSAQIARLACAHFFHIECIDGWRNSDQANREKCPVCMVPMVTVDPSVAAAEEKERRRVAGEIAMLDMNLGDMQSVLNAYLQSRMTAEALVNIFMTQASDRRICVKLLVHFITRTQDGVTPLTPSQCVSTPRQTEIRATFRRLYGRDLPAVAIEPIRIQPHIPAVAAPRITLPSSPVPPSLGAHRGGVVVTNMSRLVHAAPARITPWQERISGSLTPEAVFQAVTKERDEHARAHNAISTGSSYRESLRRQLDSLYRNTTFTTTVLQLFVDRGEFPPAPTPITPAVMSTPPAYTPPSYPTSAPTGSSPAAPTSRPPIPASPAKVTTPPVPFIATPVYSPATPQSQATSSVQALSRQVNGLTVQKVAEMFVHEVNREERRQSSPLSPTYREILLQQFLATLQVWHDTAFVSEVRNLVNPRDTFPPQSPMTLNSAGTSPAAPPTSAPQIVQTTQPTVDPNAIRRANEAFKIFIMRTADYSLTQREELFKKVAKSAHSDDEENILIALFNDWKRQLLHTDSPATPGSAGARPAAPPTSAPQIVQTTQPTVDPNEIRRANEAFKIFIMRTAGYSLTQREELFKKVAKSAHSDDEENILIALFNDWKRQLLHTDSPETPDSAGARPAALSATSAAARETSIAPTSLTSTTMHAMLPEGFVSMFAHDTRNSSAFLREAELGSRLMGLPDDFKEAVIKLCVAEDLIAPRPAPIPEEPPAPQASRQSGAEIILGSLFRRHTDLPLEQFPAIVEMYLQRGPAGVPFTTTLQTEVRALLPIAIENEKKRRAANR